MKTIIFVRHGESESNVTKIQANEIDKYPLTALGRFQIERLTQELALVRPTALYSSPVLRGRRNGWNHFTGTEYSGKGEPSTYGEGLGESEWDDCIYL
ncbi:MAG TPA: histidine phosphatase family protein [Candidatus Bathyarchaeia archaeon]|nr:histidine phosphatase family protein [Candidatus Bathyarchaeia archaeon]